MNNYSWNIYWDDYSSDTYLEGSHVIYHKKNDVEFTNNLFSPGSIIKKWYSKTNFQSQKIEPRLPIIDGESKYRISRNIECDEGEEILLELVFFDKFDEKAGSLIVRENEMDFKCPLKTYYYELRLINAGVKHFHFHNITISEINDEKEV